METLKDVSLPSSRQRWGTSFSEKQHEFLLQSCHVCAKGQSGLRLPYTISGLPASVRRLPLGNSASLRGWLPSDNLEGHLRTDTVILFISPPSSTCTFYAAIAHRVGLYEFKILLNSLKMLSHLFSKLYL